MTHPSCCKPGQASKMIFEPKFAMIHNIINDGVRFWLCAGVW